MTISLIMSANGTLEVLWGQHFFPFSLSLQDEPTECGKQVLTTADTQKKVKEYNTQINSNLFMNMVSVTFAMDLKSLHTSVKSQVHQAIHPFWTAYPGSGRVGGVIALAGKPPADLSRET